MLIFIALEHKFSGHKKAPEGASAGYETPAVLYFVRGLFNLCPNTFTYLLC